MTYEPLFNGKRIAGCEVISFNEDTMVGLANFRGTLVRFEGKSVEPAVPAEYAAVSLRLIGDGKIEIAEKRG